MEVPSWDYCLYCPKVLGVIVAGDEVGWLEILPQLPGALLTERIIA